jgi:hypothetical protein
MPAFGKERVSKSPVEAAKKIFSLSSLFLFNFWNLPGFQQLFPACGCKRYDSRSITARKIRESFYFCARMCGIVANMECVEKTAPFKFGKQRSL